MKFEGFIGPTYAMSTAQADSEECQNYLAEAVESAGGRQKTTYVLISRPGLKFFCALEQPAAAAVVDFFFLYSAQGVG